MSRLTPLACVAAAGLLLAACSDSDDGPSDGTTQQYVASVSTTINVPESRMPGQRASGSRVKAPFARLVSLLTTPPVQVTAVYHDGAPPAVTGGLDAEGELASTPFIGEPFRYQVVASGAFTIVYVLVEGMDGYYQLTLPAGVSNLELAVTLANTPPSQQFRLQALLGYEGGVSQPLVLNLEPEDLAQSDIAVTLQWTGASDLDLHVIDALGQEVAWYNPITPEGGSLDLDSNPACFIDNVNQELITWPQGSAPAGEYMVIVDYYSDCGVASSSYSVRIAVRGQNPQNVNDTFTGVVGDEERRDTVGTFTYP